MLAHSLEEGKNKALQLLSKVIERLKNFARLEVIATIVKIRLRSISVSNERSKSFLVNIIYNGVDCNRKCF